MPSDLAGFLLARITEDETAARAATISPWRVDRDSEGRPYVDAEGAHYVLSAAGEFCGDLWLDASDEDLVHVVRWDPARVLAECQAKRQVVLAYRVFWEQAKQAARAGQNDLAATARNMYAGLQTAMKCLALPYADHADYRQEWKP